MGDASLRSILTAPSLALLLLIALIPKVQRALQVVRLRFLSHSHGHGTVVRTKLQLSLSSAGRRRFGIRLPPCPRPFLSCPYQPAPARIHRVVSPEHQSERSRLQRHRKQRAPSASDRDVARWEGAVARTGHRGSPSTSHFGALIKICTVVKVETLQPSAPRSLEKRNDLEHSHSVELKPER